MFSRIAKLTSLFLIILLLTGITSIHAGGKGTYKGLYFPGSDSQKCGGWYVASPPGDPSQWVSFQRPGVVTFKVIDGTQKIILQGSQNIFDGYASNVVQLRLPAYGMPG